MTAGEAIAYNKLKGQLNEIDSLLLRKAKELNLIDNSNKKPMFDRLSLLNILLDKIRMPAKS